jgi:hypothetical protein
MGLTILIVWPETGPGKWIREQILRRLIPKIWREVLDCYICMGFWSGLLLSGLWWSWYHEPWIWTGCLIVPAVFWLVLEMGKPNG